MERLRKNYILKLEKKRDPEIHYGEFTRNLRKGDLGGVIFGCKNNTIQECYSKQLFGLPESHFSYVKNIEPGMPLFLFNFSSRKLDGIFEATSFGQLNIDPFGWADTGERSPYAAQVRMKITEQCLPLSEEQFRPIISENYHFPRFLCFELDKDQTRKLIFMFVSHVGPPLCSSKPAKCDEKISKTQEVSSPIFSNVVSCVNQDEHVLKKRTRNKKNSEPPVKSRRSSCKKKKKRDTTSGMLVLDNKNQYMDSDKLLSQTSSSLRDMEIFTSGNKSFSEKSDPILNFLPEEEGCFITKGDDAPLPSDVPKPAKIPVGSAIVNPGCEDAEFVDAIDSPVDLNNASDVCKNSFLPHSEILPQVKNHSLEVINLDENNEDTFNSKSASDPVINDSSYLETAITRLLKMNEQLIESQSFQSQKINFLEEELKISRREVQNLKDHYVSVDTGSISVSKQNNVINSDLGQGFGLHDSIFILGGFNGTSWLSSLDLYSPARDMMKPLRPMKFSRSYTSASKLVDKIYVLGGGDRQSVFNTVESYDQRTDKWICQPPLNKRNGCLAAASLNNKIYAIGGGNFTDCFSEVEVLDPNVGRWVYAKRMTQKRFSPAVATINGALVVVGGYDGTNYLKSAERLDVREPSWTKVASMNTCRGCHSLTVLGGKLYAVGGYDGSGIVKTMEVFEPKKDLWRVEESMKEPRAYAGAVTIGETMVVMGGVNADESISDTVEVYQEGRGWGSMGHKSIGKRSLFTAIVA